MSEKCEDQLGISVDEYDTFYIYCNRLKGHTGKHVYKSISTSYANEHKRKFKIRWDNPTNNSISTKQKEP